VCCCPPKNKDRYLVLVRRRSFRCPARSPPKRVTFGCKLSQLEPLSQTTKLPIKNELSTCSGWFAETVVQQLWTTVSHKVCVIDQEYIPQTITGADSTCSARTSARCDVVVTYSIFLGMRSSVHSMKYNTRLTILKGVTCTLKTS
jgi:hypothetical protein